MERILRLSGLEPLVATKQSNFVNVGERTNVTGSKAFLRLIQEDRYEEALTVAREQVEGGAPIPSDLFGIYIGEQAKIKRK